MSINQLSQLLGKSKQTIYEHMRALGSRSWLLFRSAGAATFIFSFPDVAPTEGGDNHHSSDPDSAIRLPFDEAPDDDQRLPFDGSSSVSENSENDDGLSENSETLSENSETLNPSVVVNPINSKELKRAASRNSESVSRNSESGRQRDPCLDHPAVKLYRSFTHITANQVQREKIATEVTDLETWRACLEHWLMHGWSKMNVSGMLDSYQKGGKAGCTLCHRQKTNGQRKRSEPTYDVQDADVIFLLQNPNASAERKQRAIERLKQKGIPIPDGVTP